MRKLSRTIEATPVLGVAAVFLYRCSLAARTGAKTAGVLLRWLLTSKETSNFTYEVNSVSRGHLAAMITLVTGAAYETICAYFSELDSDVDLRQHIVKIAATGRGHRRTDKDVRYGRRIGWYAVARAIKPNVIIETGVDKGMGSCVLTAALIRNAAEGHSGRYYGLDVNPEAGTLFTGRYAQYGTILTGNSLDTLPTITGGIDLFVNDSDHSARHEGQEYALVADRLNPGGIILGDNCHVTSELLEFSLATKRAFLFYREIPNGHWYPGAGIGFSFQKPVAGFSAMG